MKIVTRKALNINAMVLLAQQLRKNMTTLARTNCSLGFNPLFAVILLGVAIHNQSLAQAPETSAQNSDGEGKHLIEVTYTVWPGFFSSIQHSSDAAAADPFGDPFAVPVEQPLESKKIVTPQAFLEKSGVKFPPGTSVRLNPKTNQLIVKNTVEAHELVEIFFSSIHFDVPRQITVFLEYIEVEAAQYHEWMFENRISGTGSPLRKDVQQWVKSGEATIIETTSTLARSGYRAKVESVSQKVYPTEPGTPGVPNDILLEGEDTKAPIEAATPSAFETRNVGTTLEVDPVFGADEFTIDLNLSPEIVTENGITDWPPENSDPIFTISMPRFHVMKITAQVTTLHRDYMLLGTCKPLKATVDGRKKPIILVFARADIAVLDPYSK